MSLQTCYAPNGTILTNYGSCSIQIGNSVCCAAGQTCLSNGLCATDLGGFYSGGCTDETYASPVCPEFCASGEKLDPHVVELLLIHVAGTDHFIVSCKNSLQSAGGFALFEGYCCSGDGSLVCCSDTGNRLPIAVGTSTAQAAFVISITFSATTSDRISLLGSSAVAATTSQTATVLGGMISTTILLPT